MRIKTMGQRVCSFGLTHKAVESMGIGWMLDGWLDDGDDVDQEQLSTLVALMQSMRKVKGSSGRGEAINNRNGKSSQP